MVGSDSDGTATATTKQDFIVMTDHNVHGAWAKLFFQDTEHTERYDEG